MKAKVMVFVSICLMAILFVTACTPQETTSAPAAVSTEAPPPTEEVPAATEEAPAETEAAAEVVHIGVYSLAWSPSSIGMMQQLVEKFNTEHAGSIEAEFIQGSWDDVETYMTAGVTGGGGIADVVEYYLGGAYAWYEQGYIIDLSPYVTEEIRATMPQVLWDARTAPDGAIFFSGTVTGDNLLIYYNPAALPAAGIEPPAAGETWTWPQFIENAKLLTLDANGKHVGEEGFDSENVVQWGFMPRLDNEKVWEELSAYAMQASHQPMIRRGEDGQWDIFFDEAAMPNIEAYMSVIAEGITPMEAIGLTGDSQDEAFYQGNAAMVQRSYFNVAVLHDNYPDFEFGVMPIPMEPGSSYYQTTDGQGFAVPVTSEHPAEAAEFAFWMQKAENQALWISALMLPPCNPAAFDDPLIADNPEFDAMVYYKSIEEIVATEVNVNQDEFITTVYAPAMMDVFMGNLTLDEAIAQIKSVSRDVLNQ